MAGVTSDRTLPQRTAGTRGLPPRGRGNPSVTTEAADVLPARKPPGRPEWESLRISGLARGGPAPPSVGARAGGRS